MACRYGLEGKTVLLTGAAGGIGRALAAAFAAQGTRLLLLDREGAALAQVVSGLGDSGAASVQALVCDLNSDAAVAALAAELTREVGCIDVLVNNAGTEYPTPLADEAADPADGGATAMTRWSALIDNNLTSMVRLTRALLPLLPRGASVINQSSIWGHTGVADFSAYSASKHAVIGLTRSLAFELAPRGIRVNAVCPGWIRTGAALRSLASMAAQRGIDAAAMEREIVARQAVPAMLEPADIAGVFLFLASADAGSLTGQSISASHGEVML
jgi:NAD(P)-dependent dehydrogenase (short-subunit alcohol dehydrogenase family)